MDLVGLGVISQAAAPRNKIRAHLLAIAVICEGNHARTQLAQR